MNNDENNNNNMNSITILNEKEYVVSYSIKDVILYALSIGYGSNSCITSEYDLQYVYEKLNFLSVSPMFCFALLNYAKQKQDAAIENNNNNDNNDRIPIFPPPIMQSIIPKQCLTDPSSLNCNNNKYPLMHIFQSVIWHKEIPIPSSKCNIKAVLQDQCISVTPKSIGTFVTKVTKMKQLIEDSTTQQQHFCTTRSVVLVHGIPKKYVIPYTNNDDKFSSNNNSNLLNHLSYTISRDDNNNEILFYEDITIENNQALWYRIASGDSNSIHVDPATLPKTIKNDENGRPLLHGLCTLGHASRVVQQYALTTTTITTTNTDLQVKYLQGYFKQPVFVGDTIRIEIINSTIKKNNNIVYKGNSNNKKEFHQIIMIIDFVVKNCTTNKIVVDNGVMMFSYYHQPKDTTTSRL